MSELAIRATVRHFSQGSRPAQEDHQIAETERKIFVVADGFGGPVAGASAARSVCEEVKHFLFKEAGDAEATLPFVLRTHFSLAGNVLFNALIHANRKLVMFNRGKDVHERGGASVVAGYLDGDLLSLANVGCCSSWLLRGGERVELVIPRSYSRLCDPFRRDPEPERAVPLSAIGLNDDVEPEIAEYRIKPGDWVLFQTDGVPDSAVEEIAKLQKQDHSASESQKLVEDLLSGQADGDNISFLLVIF